MRVILGFEVTGECLRADENSNEGGLVLWCAIGLAHMMRFYCAKFDVVHWVINVAEVRRHHVSAATPPRADQQN